ncbi:Ku protein [Arthrobacter sp. Soil763]|uniref:non-homologous end joining protein Ku n=1 Tax=Arthrobacter sp. Soil763 TaxID=1736402 RepID=UPI0006FBDE45|nr:Ku protein [Arthrobacter sp. Soil763]KRE81806.1 Ku protein [Arthrobacter sp. Soil763]
MRAIWKGAIAFGLVNVPVKVYSATEDHDISLHQVHNADGGRIRYQRRCEVCSKIIDYEDIDKAFEEDGRTVVLSREELKSIPAENSHEIEVVQFVPAEQLDPMMFEKSYYLEPDAKSPKAYVLLRRALEDTDRVAVVQFALREKSRLGALRVRGDVLVLQGLLWADEVREAAFPALETSVRISAQEREMSAALVDSMAADFEPDQFTDDYQVQLRQLIDAKIEQGEALDTEETFGAPAAEAGSGEVIDLMDALKRSIERKRGAAGGADGNGETGETGKAAPAKSTTSRAKAAPKAEAGSAAKASSAGSGKSAAKTSGARKSTTAKSAASKEASKPAAKTTAAKTAGAKTTAAKTAAAKSAGAKTAAAGGGRAAARKGA